MLDFFHFAYCPHYNQEGRETFDGMLEEKNIPGLAMDSDTAFVENNGKKYFIRSDINSKAYYIKYVNGTIIKEEVKFDMI